MTEKKVGFKISSGVKAGKCTAKQVNACAATAKAGATTICGSKPAGTVRNQCYDALQSQREACVAACGGA